MDIVFRVILLFLEKNLQIKKKEHLKKEKIFSVTFKNFEFLEVRKMAFFKETFPM